MEGVCADCWVAKVPGAYEAMRRPPRTEPFFDWGSLDFFGLEWWLVLRLVFLAVAIGLGLLFGLR